MLRKVNIFILIFIISLSVRPVFASTPDEILEEAISIDIFLNGKDLNGVSFVEKYFNAFSQYYFTLKREVYNEFISQISFYAKKSELFKSRIWQGPFDESYSYKTQFEKTGNGRSMNSDLWREDFHEYISETYEDLGYKSKTSRAKFLKKIREELKRLIAIIERQKVDGFLEIEESGLSKKDQKVMSTKLLNRIKVSHEMTRASYILQLLIFESEQFKSSLVNTDSIEIFINGLKDFSGNKPSIPILYQVDKVRVPDILRSSALAFSRSDFKLFGFKTSPIWKALPDKYFPKIFDAKGVWVGASGDLLTVNMKSIRPFHTIFVGHNAKECVGGEEVNEISPRRWASTLLEGPILLEVRRNGTFNGVIRLIPMRYEADKEHVYASFEPSATVLSQSYSNGGKRKHIFSRILKEVDRIIPDNWKLVASNSSALSNYGVFNVINKHESFIMGQEIDSKKLIHIDQNFANIISENERYYFEEKYGQDLGTDFRENLVNLEKEIDQSIMKYLTDEYNITLGTIPSHVPLLDNSKDNFDLSSEFIENKKRFYLSNTEKLLRALGDSSSYISAEKALGVKNDKEVSTLQDAYGLLTSVSERTGLNQAFIDDATEEIYEIIVDYYNDLSTFNSLVEKIKPSFVIALPPTSSEFTNIMLEELDRVKGIEDMNNLIDLMFIGSRLRSMRSIFDGSLNSGSKVITNSGEEVSFAKIIRDYEEEVSFQLQRGENVIQAKIKLDPKLKWVLPGQPEEEVNVLRLYNIEPEGVDGLIHGAVLSENSKGSADLVKVLDCSTLLSRLYR